jgi:ABC-type lipoprotein export system ATPase subunit
MSALLELKNIRKHYDDHTPVLQDVSLLVEAGERGAILGASGCGKSTLLNMGGALDRPDSGMISFEGTDVLAMNEKQSAAFRNREVGFIFQLHHLLPQCTVLENAMVPALVNKERSGVRERALHLLDRVGLSHRLSHRPGQLSGGERQRVAVVRALINRPRLLLADEPTGSLNRKGADELTDLLLELNREEQLAMIMVTHSEPLAQRLGRICVLEDGALK